MDKNTGNINTALLLLLIASIAINSGFLMGCASLHNAVYGSPCKVSAPVQTQVVDDGRERLAKIARLVGIETDRKTSSDLENDLSDFLDRFHDVPEAFDDEKFEKMSKDLNQEEKAAMGKYQEFISGLQGKRIIVIDGDGED